MAPHEHQSNADDAAKPFEIARNNAAGVKLYKFPRFKQVQLRFEHDVPAAIDDRLHQEGWRFRQEEGVYTKQFGQDGQAAAIIEARRLYGELCRTLAPEPAIAF